MVLGACHRRRASPAVPRTARKRARATGGRILSIQGGASSPCQRGCGVDKLRSLVARRRAVRGLCAVAPYHRRPKRRGIEQLTLKHRSRRCVRNCGAPAHLRAATWHRTSEGQQPFRWRCKLTPVLFMLLEPCTHNFSANAQVRGANGRRLPRACVTNEAGHRQMRAPKDKREVQKGDESKGKNTEKTQSAKTTATKENNLQSNEVLTGHHAARAAAPPNTLRHQA
jgi:hypothetical protein